MRNYIILNDQNSNDISGLLIQSLAPISKPLMRTEIEEIDGRDGDITTKLGYSAYDKQITIGLFGNYDVDQVIAFFNSEGTAIFSNEPNKYYNYQIVDQIDFERLVRYKTATVTMHCQPFKYSTTEGADILSSSDNFATLNQSLNTDSGFYTYSSNVQADVTATRQSGTGGKFFAVFTVPVVQGVNYHFSGNVSRNVSMYGYTDQLRGTSAGIAGKGFSGNFVYTATFTGTMVLGFYSNATTEIFIRNFAISNEAGTTISDEGTNLVLEGSQLAPFSQFDLKGNTEQSGTPAPDAPVPVKVVTGENTVQICGKNLFDNNSAVIGKVWNGQSNNKRAYGYIEAVQGQQYTVSTQNTNTDLSLSVVETTTIGSVSTAVKQTTLTNTLTFTPRASTKYIVVQFGTTNATMSQTIVDDAKVQIELGSSASSFEPYQEQSYTVNLDIGGGKNLLKYSWSYTAGYYDGSGVWSTDARFACYDKYFEVEPNTTYSFSSSHSNTNMAILWFDENKNWVSRTATTSATSASGASPATAKYARLQVRYETNTTISNALLSSMSLQFEQGSVSSYEPFVCYELCKIGDYQDYLYKSGGDWYVHKATKKLIYNGTEAWNSWYNIDNCIGFYNYSVDDAAVIGGESAINNALWCNMFSEPTTRYSIVGGSAEGVKQCGGAGRQYIALGINKSRLSDYSTSGNAIASLKTWLAANPTTVYHTLATPTDTTITNAALIEQLEAIANQAHAYKERTHVSSTYATGNAPHIIAAAVIGDASGTVTNSGNIYSKPKLTIFGSGDIGVYLNGVQMFQIALGDSGYITIDTALMEAYQDNLQTLMNRQVTGDYSNFVLNPGDNQISFTGSVSMCVVENYSRWL